MGSGDAQAAGGRRLEVEVANFGPISRGRLTVGPVTVLVGPNNSGKTHMSTLVHSVLSAYRDARADGMAGIVRAHVCGPEFRAALAEMKRAIKGAGDGGVDVPARCAEVATSMALRHFEAKLLHSIMRNFGTGMESLVRIGSKSATIRIAYNARTKITIGDGRASVRSDFSGARYLLVAGNGRVAVRDPSGSGSPWDAGGDGDGWDAARFMVDMLGVEGDEGMVAMLMLMRRIMSGITEGVPSSRYIPSGRAMLLENYRDIAADVVRGAGEAAKSSPGEEVLTGLKRDFVSDVIRIKEKNPARPPKRDDDMMVDMFGGHIVVLRPHNMMPSIMYRFRNADIPLHRTSSGISETAALPIFFDNYVHDNCVLIIDEPESHLHPENQIKVTKHIIKGAKQRNSHVIIATHSVFILEQLSLLLKTSQLNEKQMSAVGAKSDFCIAGKNIFPYLFVKKSDGSHTITEMGHSPDAGIDQGEFIRVTESLYKNYVRVERELEK